MFTIDVCPVNQYWILDNRVHFYSNCLPLFNDIGYWAFAYNSTVNVYLVHWYWILDNRVHFYSKCLPLFNDIGYWAFAFGCWTFTYVSTVNVFLVHQYWILDIHVGLRSYYECPKRIVLPLTSAHRYLLLVINHNQKSLPPDFHPEVYFLPPNLGVSPIICKSAHIEKEAHIISY